MNKIETYGHVTDEGIMKISYRDKFNFLIISLSAMLLLIQFTSMSQCGYQPSAVGKYLRSNTGPIICMFSAGVANGTVELLSYRYDKIDKLLNLNDRFWNPEQSWENKWHGGVKEQGEAYPMSSTTLVFTTDGYHLVRAVQGAFICGAVAFKIGKRQKWYMYFIDLAVYSFTYKAGFWLSYELINLKK